MSDKRLWDPSASLALVLSRRPDLFNRLDSVELSQYVLQGSSLSLWNDCHNEDGAEDADAWENPVAAMLTHGGADDRVELGDDEGQEPDGGEGQQRGQTSDPGSYGFGQKDVY